VGEEAHRPRLVELIVGDEPDAWSRAGFDVRGDRTRIGTVGVRLVGADGGRGIVSWGFEGLAEPAASLDGVAIHDPPEPDGESAELVHPNGVRAFDHLVVASPDLDRTLAALTDQGFELRRTRDIGGPDRPRRQLFFWMGEPILELVGPASPSGDGPSRLFGLALTVADLDATAASLGEGCGRVKDAVQPGRRIATLRHEPLGMSVPVAFMSAHVDPADAEGVV
jgi:hypothetical protein